MTKDEVLAALLDGVSRYYANGQDDSEGYFLDEVEVLAALAAMTKERDELAERNKENSRLAEDNAQGLREAETALAAERRQGSDR